MKDRILRIMLFITYIPDKIYLLYLRSKTDFNIIRGRNKTTDILFELELPVQYMKVSLHWNSSSKLLDEYGNITPNDTQQDIPFILTCVFKKNLASVKKEFHLKHRAIQDKNILSLEHELLSYESILGRNTDQHEIQSDLTLSKKGITGCDLTWVSSNPSIIDEEGHLHREKLVKDENIVLICHLRYKNDHMSKNFTIKVKALNTSTSTNLIIVPHGDDELLMAHGVIENILQKNEDIFICFMTNADSKGKEDAFLRHKMTIASLGYLGIPSHHIYCLGYSNNWKNINHIYHAEDSYACVSKHGYTKTYGSNHMSDYHFLKYGESAMYTRENLLQDLKDVILDCSPNNIFINDMDEHPDHRALSLLFDKVMGEIINDQALPHIPKIYKGFIYSTYAYGKSDFFRKRMRRTKKPNKWNPFRYHVKAYSRLENPGYNWEERCSIPTPLILKNMNLKENISVRAFTFYNRMYHSVYSFINDDTVFWERENDNLLSKAEIKASSGNVHFLHDFMINDTSDITSRKLKFDQGIWIPNVKDTNKSIFIRFQKITQINQIIIYENPSKYQNILEIELLIDEQKPNITSITKRSNRVIIEFEKMKISHIKLSIISSVGNNAGITELIIRDKQANEPLPMPIHKKQKWDFSMKFVYPFIAKKFWS